MIRNIKTFEVIFSRNTLSGMIFLPYGIVGTCTNTFVRLVYIYMFICTELIEETGRSPGLIFGLARTSSKFENLKKIKNSEISNFFRIPEARSAKLKQTTTASRLFFAQSKS